MARCSSLLCGAVMFAACLACSERARGETVTFSFTGTTSSTLTEFAGGSGKTNTFHLAYSLDSDVPGLLLGDQGLYNNALLQARLDVGGLVFVANTAEWDQIKVVDGLEEDLDERLDQYQLRFTGNSASVGGDVSVTFFLNLHQTAFTGIQNPDQINPELLMGGTISLEGPDSASLSISSLSVASVPTPAAALAAPVLMGMVALRRRRT